MKLYYIILAIILVAILGYMSGIQYYWTQETVTFTVTEKERIAEDGGGKYLIFTENEVFKNADCLWAGKFSSSDLYSEIEEGETYTAVVCGWRVPFLSWYRNIIRIEESRNP